MNAPILSVIILTASGAIVAVVYIMLAFFKKSKLKKLEEEMNPKEYAYNQVQILRSIINLMKNKNYDTKAVESMVEKAQSAYNRESYAEAIEIVNNAKRVLERARRENKEDNKLSPQIAQEMRIIKKIESESSADHELPTPLKELEKEVPDNFLQSKFEIKVVEEKIMGKENGEIKSAAMLYLTRAKSAFEGKDYTEALRLAIKSNKILETGELPVVELEQKRPDFNIKNHQVSEIVEEEKEEINDEVHCPKCGALVRTDDKFCWNCGAKLIFIYQCPNCGADVSSEDRFCRNCGYKLK